MKAWGLVAKYELVSGNFEKWPHGPVNPDVYHKFKTFQSNPIMLSASSKAQTPFAGQEKKTADFILERYAQYSAVTLSAMSHADLPWKKTGDCKVISDKSLF